jgi:hypothetical protein
MDLPAWGWHPLRRKPVNVTTERPTQIEGCEVIKLTDPNDITMYQAPQLNLFSLRVAMCKEGGPPDCGITMSEVSIGEPPFEYFKPPVGERVIRRSEPGGIVRRNGR